MSKISSISTAAILVLSAFGVASVPANATVCRDTHGRFASCATAGAARTHTKRLTATKTAARPVVATRARTTVAKPAVAKTAVAKPAPAKAAPVAAKAKK